MTRLLVAVAALAVLAACNGSGTDSVDAVPASTAPSATTASLPITTSPATTSAPATTAAARPATVAELLTRPVVLAHAGGDDDYPHSTPYAFAESVKGGVDVLDLDVRLASDGVLVVQHDEDLQRTTENNTDKVAALTYAQLHALDNAYWFNTTCNTCKNRPAGDYLYRGIRTGAKPPPPGYTPDDFAITRFTDLARRFPGLPLNIEIKGTMDDGIGVPVATALATDLKALGREDSTVVTSFDDGVLAAFHQLAPNVMLSPGLQATAAWVLGGTPLPDGMRILQIPPEYQGLTVLTPDLVTRAEAAGYPLWIWPNGDQYENEAGYRQLFEMGVEGVNASKPAAGVRARESA